MPTSIEAQSLLAIHVGSVTTRAAFFDAVEGVYRFVAIGMSPTTVGPPLFDGSEGIRRSVQNLQEITGRAFFDEEGLMVIPASAAGFGIDIVAGAVSAGQPLRLITMGLLDDISLESANRLAATFPSQVLDQISIADSRRLDVQTDAIINHQPEAIIITGGTENGASKSVMKLLESVGLACYLMTEEMRPYVLFAGNQGVAEEVREALNRVANIIVAPNVRPALESEHFGPAQKSLGDIFRQVQGSRDAGLRELDGWTDGRMQPASLGFSRVIKFLSEVYRTRKGVLGIDIGASSTSIASAYRGQLAHRVYPSLGLGHPLSNILQESSMANIVRWLPVDIPEDDIRTYIFDKTVHPASLPQTEEELYLEHALAREVIRTALNRSSADFPPGIDYSEGGLLPWFEPIVVSGSAITQAPTYGQALLLLLDAVQPTGITTFVSDPNNLLPSLGIAAETNPLLLVQALEAGTLLNLATVISPVGNAKTGSIVLRLKLDIDGAGEKVVEVAEGSIEVVRLPVGRTASLQLQPQQGYDVGMAGPGRGGKLRGVAGSELGVVIDARGRPLDLPQNVSRRRQLLLRWQSMFNR
jgi:hypothetical protein